MENSNKIFIWSPFTSKVGTVNNVINFAKSLIKFSKPNQFDVSFINSFGEWNNYKNELIKKKIKLYNFLNLNYFLKWKKEGFLKSRISYLIIFLTSLFPLIKLLKKEKPKYLFCYLVTSLPIILFLFGKYKTKLILNIAGQPKLNFFRKFLWKRISNKIYFIICPSYELKENLKKLNVFDEKKIIVIQDPHLMVGKVNRLKSIELNDEFFDNSKIIISIGRLTKQKNFKFLITNFDELYKRYNDLKLVIIGDGEEKDSLINLINKLKLEKKIKILGYKENIYKYLKESNYFISTSDWEGSSLAMIDAAFIGLPILCSDCPTGRKEFIGNDERGYLYSNNSKKDFLNKFDNMFNEHRDTLTAKLISAKKETKKFTFFYHYLNLRKII